MRRHIAALLALLAVAAPSFAQTPVGVQSMTPSRTSIGNTSGALHVVDPFQYNPNTEYPACVNTGAGGLAPGSALTSSPLDTRGWKGMALMVYGLGLGAEAQTRYAVSIRGGYSPTTDSTSSLPWAPWRKAIATTSGITYVGPDTVGAWASGVANMGHLADASTSHHKQLVAPGEFLVVLNPNDALRGRYINLDDEGGRAFTAPYTVVRVRALAGRNNAGAFTDSTTVKVFRADLVRTK